LYGFTNVWFPFVAFYVVCLIRCFVFVTRSLFRFCCSLLFTLLRYVRGRSFRLLRSTLFYVPRYGLRSSFVVLIFVPFVAVLVFAFCVRSFTAVVRSLFVTLRFVTLPRLRSLFVCFVCYVRWLFVVRCFVRSAFVFTLFSLFVRFTFHVVVRWVVTFVYVVAGSRLLPRLRLPLRVCSGRSWLLRSFVVRLRLRFRLRSTLRSFVVGWLRSFGSFHAFGCSYGFVRLYFRSFAYVCLRLRLRCALFVRSLLFVARSFFVTFHVHVRVRLFVAF
jgi:hypothetical protein